MPEAQRKKGGSRLGYHAYYVLDGDKARVILSALVTPAGVMENEPMRVRAYREAEPYRKA